MVFFVCAVCQDEYNVTTEVSTNGVNILPLNLILQQFVVVLHFKEAFKNK